MPVGRHSLPREVMEAHQRDRILAVATEVFAKRGYRSTTVDHIVAAAKIGVGSFYELFDNKEDCLLRAYDRVVAHGRERIAAAVPADRPWPERAAAVLRALLELIAAEPSSARLALVVVQTGGAEALARYESTLDGVVPLLRRGREASPVAGELPDSLEDAIVGGLAWFLQQRVETAEAGSAEQPLPELLRLVIEPYLGEDAVSELIAAQSAAAARD